MTAQLLTITETAVERVKALMSKSDAPVQGLRVGITTRG